MAGKNFPGNGKAGARFPMVKGRHRQTLQKAIKEGKADRQMVPLLEFIASSREFFTSSRCAGRIILLKLDSEGSKAESAFIRRWHRKVKFSELWKALEESPKAGEVWLKLDPFILHAGTDSLENARRLLKIMQAAGVKRGGIINAKEGRFIVEMIGTQAIALPVMNRGRPLAGKGYLKWLLGKANAKLARNYSCLKRLEKAFRGELGE